MFVTGHGFVPDPTQMSYVGQMNIYPGWWNSRKVWSCPPQIWRSRRVRGAHAIWEQIQQLAYEEIPAIKIGDGADIVRDFRGLGGWDPQTERGVKFWNLWLK